MKKGVMFAFAIFLFLSTFSIISAELNASQITSGFSCLSSKIGDCTSLSLGEKIFASLTTGQCISSVESSAASNGCFPSGSCDIKTTSQAILSLKQSGRSTTDAATWLLSSPQTKPTSGIDWFLQIDSAAATSCTVSYAGASPQTILINEDKTVANSAPPCLTVSSSGYWLLISPSCYGTEFSIACNQPFATTELYQRSGFPTIYVSSSSNSASQGGTVKNSVNSSCFGTGAACNYESSLWAALALDNAGKDISSFIPYLTVFADDTQNQQYLPYSFMYSLTSSSDFLEKLLDQQKTVNTQSYWDQGSVSGSYFDTALALLPLQTQSPPEKSSSLDWLGSTQGSDGCWNSGNLVDTAFILYSVSGSRAASTTSTSSCSSSGYYCLSSTSSCAQSGGSVLQGYTCSGAYVCCSHALVLPTCSAQTGVICNSGQICQGGSAVTASDTQSGQFCCVSGSCASPQPTSNACELVGATCRNSCLSGEQPLAQSCDTGSQVCCGIKSKSSGVGWIILLIMLILLTALGIVFRKQLRLFWMKLKDKFKKGKGGPSAMPSRPSFPPRGPPMTFQRRMPPPHRLPPPKQKPTEVNEVLKRLKEVGK